MTPPGQTQITYIYDDANRLKQAAQGTLSANLGYDNAGRRTTLAYLPSNVQVSYGYDPASRLTGITYQTGSTVLGNLTYAYDPAGQRISVGGTWARTGLPAPVVASHNRDNQITDFSGGSGNIAFSYDPNGNLTSD